jgi:hypothetical protein
LKKKEKRKKKKKSISGATFLEATIYTHSETNSPTRADSRYRGQSWGCCSSTTTEIDWLRTVRKGEPLCVRAWERKP